VQYIVPLLDDSDKEVGLSAARALKHLKWKGEDPARQIRYHLYLNEWSELGKLKQYAVPALRVALKSSVPSTRKRQSELWEESGIRIHFLK
jgi:hypothetical protein